MHTVRIKFGSIEVAEVRFPLHFRHHEFPKLRGDGQFARPRSRSIWCWKRQKPRANTAGDGVRTSLRNLGGEDGVPHDCRLISRSPPRALRTKESASRFVRRLP